MTMAALPLNELFRRIYRDLSIYARHDNADHLLATIGREAMGKSHDVSFFHLEEPALRLESVNGQAPSHLARQLTSE